MNLPKNPTAWACRVCKKIDFYGDNPPSAFPEHVPHRGVDIGTCIGKMIPLYSEEDLLAVQQDLHTDAVDSAPSAEFTAEVSPSAKVTRQSKQGEKHEIGILTPHESIPVSTDFNRQFLRIVSSGVHGREPYFTENPLVKF